MIKEIMQEKFEKLRSSDEGLIKLNEAASVVVGLGVFAVTGDLPAAAISKVGISLAGGTAMVIGENRQKRQEPTVRVPQPVPNDY